MALAARLDLNASDDTSSGHVLKALAERVGRLSGGTATIKIVLVSTKRRVVQVGKAHGVVREGVGDKVALLGALIALPLGHAVAQLVGRLITRVGGEQRGKRVHVARNAARVRSGLLEAQPRLALNLPALVREVVADEVVQLLVGGHDRPLSVPRAGGATVRPLARAPWHN